MSAKQSKGRGVIRQRFNSRGEDVGNTKDVLTLGDVGSEGDGGRVLRGTNFLGSLGG